jgi:hypothetical protein
MHQEHSHIHSVLASHPMLIFADSCAGEKAVAQPAAGIPSALPAIALTFAHPATVTEEDDYDVPE